jgi:large subunit ribosomal protein L30
MTMKIKLVRSLIGRSADQVATAKSLGLKGINDVAEVPDTPAVLGKVNKIKFLLEVLE